MYLSIFNIKIKIKIFIFILLKIRAFLFNLYICLSYYNLKNLIK